MARAPVSVRRAGVRSERRSLFRGVAAFVLTLLALVAQTARAHSLHLSSAPPGATLVAGERVTVSWSGLPDGVDEVELLLSVDGGESFPLRLTESFDPGPASTTWLVPAIATRSARLRLRIGRDGREEDGGDSAAFAIAVLPASRPPRLLYRQGEWWIAEGTAPASAGPGPGGPVELHGTGGTFAPAVVPDHVNADASPGTGLSGDGAGIRVVPLPASASGAFAPSPRTPKRE